MNDLGSTLRQARVDAGLSLAGMAQRTGFSRSYLGNVEKGVRAATPAVIKAYEQALGTGVNRRSFLAGIASTAITGPIPDVAVDVARDIAAARTDLLSSVQTTHQTDRTISALVARDMPCVGSLGKWMRKGSPVLRVNAAGILAKVGSPALDGGVVQSLKADEEARGLYLQAVVSRVLQVPWTEAERYVVATQPVEDAAQLGAIAAEVRNPYDSAARWCSVLLLGRMRPEAQDMIDPVLADALREEGSRENLRAIASVLAGLDPLTV